MKALATSLFLLAVAASSPGREDTSSVALPSVDAAANALVADGKVAGAVVLVAQDGEVIHRGAYGVRSLESGAAMTSDTIFRIHSMTKAMVSAAALQLLEQGKYSLEDPLSKHIPAFSEMKVLQEDGSVTPAEHEITIEDLFRHTSGLAYGFTAPEELVEDYSSRDLWGGTSDAFCEFLAEIPLVHEPGQSWCYGVNTDVIGRLVEVWSGQSLDAYLEENFFGPLKMKDTGFWIEGGPAAARFASVHQSGKDGVKLGDDPLGQKYLEKPKMMSGGGGLVSTANDYYQFLQMIADGGTRFGHEFLKPETVKLMTTNQLPETISHISVGGENRTKVGFGLGFSVVTGFSKDWDEAAPVGEYGWGGAASCHYWVSPEDDNLIVITLEQTVPYNWNMEWTLKPVIYGALRQ